MITQEKNNRSCIIYFILFYFFLIISYGCNAKSNEPIRAGDNVTFGQYKLSPPNGYWYFQRKFPEKFISSEDYFLITFWKDKNSIPNKTNQISEEVFFNFAVFKNEYKNFDSYYSIAESHNIIYEELPEKIKFLKNTVNWNCRYSLSSSHSIECISLRDNLIVMAAVGHSKAEVLNKIYLLEKMINSFSE